MQLQPWKWIRIDAIAKDVERFIDIVECLYNHGYFVDEQNFLIIELSKDNTQVRLDPMYIRNHDTKNIQNMEIKFRANNTLLLDYLRHIFGAEQTGLIRLSLTNDFGRMVVGLYKTCDKPVETVDDELTVTLVMPSASSYMCRRYPLYLLHEC